MKELSSSELKQVSGGLSLDLSEDCEVSFEFSYRDGDFEYDIDISCSNKDDDQDFS